MGRTPQDSSLTGRVTVKQAYMAASTELLQFSGAGHNVSARVRRGNYRCGVRPYFTNDYRTSVGTPHFDWTDSDEVVGYFVETLYWLRDIHFRCPAPGCNSQAL